MENRNKICVVTGGRIGIGRGIAEVLLREGATVVIASRDEAGLQKTAQALSAAGVVIPLALDIGDRDSVRRFVDQVLGKFGRVDVLVNNAGLMPMPCALKDFDDRVWDALMLVNITGTYNVTKALLPAMLDKKVGRIITISSISASKTWPNFVAYAAAKSALFGFTTALAQEVAGQGITVNTILPGFTRTEEMERIWGKIAADNNTTMEALLQPVFDQTIPMHRWLAPKEIGEAVSFLASDRAAGITGHLFKVDAGIDAHA